MGTFWDHFGTLVPFGTKSRIRDLIGPTAFVSYLPFDGIIWFLDAIASPSARGKVMSQGANKLQRPFLANSIYSRGPIQKMQ